MYANSAYSTYAQNNAGVESPEKLIEMLYEGVLRFNAQTKKAIKDKEREKKFYWNGRSVAVISELISSLNMEAGDVSLYLIELYQYQVQSLLKAVAHDDTEKVDEVTNVFKGLLEAWREETNVA